MPTTPYQLGALIRANTTTTGTQDAPTITSLAGGGFVVTWRSNPSGNVNGAVTVTAQVFDADGGKVGGEITVGQGMGVFNVPKIIPSSDGGFFVFWETLSGVNGADTVGRRFGADGTANGASFLVHTADTAFDQWAPDATLLSDGTFIVTWTDRIGAAANVYARHFSATGTPLAAQFRVNKDITAHADSYSVAAALASGFVIAWEDSKIHGIRFQMYADNGAAVGAQSIVTTAAWVDNAYSNMAMTALAGGGFVVTWTSGSSYFDVHARIYSAAGLPVGNEIVVNTSSAGASSATGSQRDSSVSAGPDGGFVVTWYDDKAGEVRGQAFNATGGTVGAEFHVPGTGAKTIYADSNEGDVSVLADGRIAVTFWSANDVYVRLYGTASNIVQGTSAANTLTGTNAADLILAGGGNDTVDGGKGDDTVDGGSGDDRLTGGEGADLLIGGDGIDTADYSGSAAAVTVTLATSRGTGKGGAAEGDILVGIENLVGSALADTLTGSNGDNVLDGGGGADSMAGGSGNDSYYVDNAGDRVTEANFGGIDTVYSSIASYTLTNYVENLVLQGSAVDGLGNALANTLTGNAAANHLYGFNGDDLLDGKGGADSMYGGLGNDSYIVADAGDVVVEMAGQGIDTVTSSISYALTANVENLILTGSAATGTGNALANKITGNTRDNTLTGDIGADTLTGGGGNDTFVYNALADSSIAASDRIVDFQAGDLIDVRAIDANRLQANDQAFVVDALGVNTFATGHIRQLRSGANLILDFNVDAGTATSEMRIVLLNFSGSLTAANFKL